VVCRAVSCLMPKRFRMSGLSKKGVTSPPVSGPDGISRIAHGASRWSRSAETNAFRIIRTRGSQSTRSPRRLREGRLLMHEWSRRYGRAYPTFPRIQFSSHPTLRWREPDSNHRSSLEQIVCLASRTVAVGEKIREPDGRKALLSIETITGEIEALSRTEAKCRQLMCESASNGDPTPIPRKYSVSNSKRRFGGVPIGADRDPSCEQIIVKDQSLVSESGGVPLRC
jgi:hypothetical protein